MDVANNRISSAAQKMKDGAVELARPYWIAVPI